MDDILAKLRARNAEMQNRDSALRQELDGLRDRIGPLPEVLDTESMAAMAAPVPALAESVADIAIDHGRLAMAGGLVETPFGAVAI